MTKYEYLKESLEKTGKGIMKCFGNSMLPILTNPSICSYEKQDSYDVGDIVFCRVKGRFIDAHLITKIDNGRYMISNNHNYDNGWTKTIYGKVVSAINKDRQIIYTAKQ
jgi:hypothetical protein